MVELLTWLKENDIHIAAIQETKLTNKSKEPNTGEYTLVRNDRSKNKGGGLAFLIHKTINFQRLPINLQDEHIEIQAISVDNLNIINIYIPPNSSCSQNYSASLLPILQYKDSLILGDINAHDPLWYSQLNDERGNNIAEEISNSNLAF